MFLLCLSSSIFVVTFFSGTGLLFSFTTSIFLSALYLISDALVSSIRNRILRGASFIFVFTAFPFGISLIAANGSNLTQKVGGRDIFVDGAITTVGFMSLLLTLAATALIIAVSKELFASTANKER